MLVSGGLEDHNRHLPLVPQPAQPTQRQKLFHVYIVWSKWERQTQEVAIATSFLDFCSSLN